MKRMFTWLARGGAVLLLPVGLALGAWWWAASESSLGTSLYFLSRVMPPGQTLEIEGVSGSLQQGGKLQELRWRNGLLQVRAKGVEVHWDASALWEQKLRVSQLRIEQLQIDDQRPTQAAVAPTELTLPMTVDLPLDVASLEWSGPPALRASNFQGQYRFDGSEHRLDVATVQMASGTYQGSASVQARGTLALRVALSGTLHTTLPKSGKPLDISAAATLAGDLGPSDTVLQLRANLVPKLAVSQKDAMQADLLASMQPWRKPLFTQARAEWRALDLASLWPQAPTTLLDGEAAVTPSDSGWSAQVHASNRSTGSWATHHLPVEQLSSRFAFANEQWIIESLTAKMGDGHVDLLGSLSDGGQWQGSAKLTGINPATLDERFAVSLVGGDVVVSQNLDGLAFDAHLQSSSAIGGAGMAKKQPAWMVKEFRAKGLWTAPRLQLDAFNLEVPDAQLRGSLQFDRNTWSASGHVAGVVPGARVKIDGGISSDRGQGDMVLELSDAGQLATWLSRWPGASGWKDSIRKFDHAAAKLHWDGGWQAFTLTSGGQVLRGTLDAGWELKSQGRRTTDGAWEAHVDALQLYALVRGERWALQTNQSVALSWVPDGASRRIQVAEGSAQLSGPRPGAVQLIWQPAQWSQKLQNDANGGAWQWACRGQLKNLPLDWLTNLASATASKIGLEGDMVLGGQWDASGQDGALQLRASLERARGDIEISADELGNAPLKAGVRDASLNLSILNENVQAQLNWDSAAAGVAHASATTRLEHQASGWSWPPDAALEGRFQAQLPRLRVWSMLAPPGWRLTGTLDADAQLSGSRSAPRWKGILLARELSVRSVLDGVDFSKGAMRINMDGDGLDIAEFTLQGASAGPVSGGTLSLTGSVRWPEEDAATQVTSRLRMNLQATAKDLRVSTRADQRLVVSGKVFAALENAILEVTGALTADQASFVLSEESTPKLGNDVRVRGAPTAQGTVASPLGSRGASFGKSVEPRVNVTLDLGPNFQVQGYGLNTRLGGKLELATTHEFVPRLTGQIHTVSGTYKAYGQQLDIEAGELRFDGSFDNPGLDILAIRPNIVQRVGVQMGGTALLPVVRLYAEPDLPDAEKLSWLVVGHANADGSAQMAMLQQAAMTMVSRDGQPLTSGLANAIGLDEISMGGLGTNGGSATATGATVKLGKRLAGNFYVAYEHSVAGAYGTFYIFYDLSKRFTLRGQTGKQSAADLIFTARYD